MKAIIITSLIFFSLRAMSAQVGEDKKGECIYSDQSKREAKVVDTIVTKEVKQSPAQTISK